MNPHYKNMGWLYGSEYWTYLLPKRVGWDCAIELTESCLPVSAKRAKQLGLIDELIESDHASFVDYVREFARSKLSLAAYLSAKKRLRLQADERRRPLNAYRTHELAQMYKNFYFPNSPYHLARSAFVKSIQLVGLHFRRNRKALYGHYRAIKSTQEASGLILTGDKQTPASKYRDSSCGVCRDFGWNLFSLRDLQLMAVAASRGQVDYLIERLFAEALPAVRWQLMGGLFPSICMKDNVSMFSNALVGLR